MRRGCEYFPRLVEARAELPAPLRDALDQAHPSWRPEEIVIIPPQRQVVRRWSRFRELPFGVHLTPHRTVVFGDEQITLVEEAPEGALRVWPIPAPDLVAIRLETILLYADFELLWIAAGQVEMAIVEFNSVGLRWIERGLTRMRTTLGAAHRPARGLARDDAAFAPFPHKFRSYLWFSLMPGEGVRRAVYQPAIRRAEGRFRPYLSPNRVIALTEQTLLVLEDAPPRAFGWDTNRYRIAQHFYPRDRVRAIAFEHAPDAIWMRATVGDAHAQVNISWPLEEPAAATLQADLTGWLSVPAGQPITPSGAPEPL